MIRKGVNTDISKCFNEGKAVVIEGYGIDPDLYIDYYEEKENEQIIQNRSKNIKDIANLDKKYYITMP